MIDATDTNSLVDTKRSMDKEIMLSDVVNASGHKPLTSIQSNVSRTGQGTLSTSAAKGPCAIAEPASDLGVPGTGVVGSDFGMEGHSGSNCASSASAPIETAR